MWRTRQAVAAAVLLATGGMTHAWGQRLFFFDEDGGGGRPRGCYVFDVAIGTSTLLFEVPPNIVIDSMTTSKPVLIMLAVDSAASSLYRVDLLRGRFELIRPLGVEGISGLAQHRQWGTYAITNRGDLYQSGGGRLNFVGNIAPVTAGLTFSPNGVLYGFDGANGDLYSVEPSKPSRTRLGGSGDPIGPVTDATVTWDGELFVADYTGALFRVSLDGRRTRVGATGLGDGLLGLAPEPSACEPCDVNCDGEINAFDIEPFLYLLFEPCDFCCSPCNGDANRDGVVDVFDIEPFLECLFP